MYEGMLWYDDDKSRSLEEKVLRAASYYEEKYGQTPNICYVNTQLAGDAALVKTAGLKLCPAANMLPHHFWVGVVENGNNATRN